jgi:site-specific DNA-cytosine methylase
MEKKGITVLSLFDGIGTGLYTLKKSGILVDKYYASEIDKFVIGIAKYNYPEIIHIGDVRDVKTSELPKIDLLIGGSPCTDLSIAGSRKGFKVKDIEITSLEQYLELKESGFEFEGQSYLFWEYIRILKETKPKWFLLENVRMKKKWKDLITKMLGVEPIEIDSSLVSAQKRKRLYWTNIPVKGLPKNRSILLKDILQTEVHQKYYTNRTFKLTSDKKYIVELDNEENIKQVYPFRNKFPTIIKSQDGYPKVFLIEKKAYCLTASYSGVCPRDYLIKYNRQMVIEAQVDNINDLLNKEEINLKIRRLTPIECERLQTLPDGYTEYGNFNGKIRKISDTQRYKCLGNGWTAEVIAWIFSFLKQEIGM